MAFQFGKPGIGGAGSRIPQGQAKLIDQHPAHAPGDQAPPAGEQPQRFIVWQLADRPLQLDGDGLGDLRADR